jgi:hypothetical protein
MKYTDRQIRTVGDLIDGLRRQTSPSDLAWFRGQVRAKWQLVPSLGRKGVRREAEISLIKRFKQNAFPHIAQRPQTDWEWLFLMQHHRLPTRLLDWTESPLTALYFAVEFDKAHEDEDGAIWCLDPIALNRQANVEYPFETEVPAFDHDKILESYLPRVIASEATSQLSPVAAIASRNSARIVAQQGTFTITHRKMTPVESVGSGDHIWRLIVPAKSKRRLREELQYLHFTELTLFPELDKVAAEARRIL